MKKIKYYIPLLAVILFCSCLSLDQEPRDTITDAAFWKTPGDFENAANEFFFSLEEFPSDGESDIMSSSHLNTVSNGTHLATPSDGVWDTGFAYVRLTNGLIARYEISDIKSQVDAYKGEALFFRAYHYFKMYKRFGAVPIVKTVLDIDSPEVYGPRNSRTEVENFILDDLEEAISLLPNIASGGQVGRITKGIALGFKSRVALFIGTWAKYHGTRSDYNDILNQAIDAADKVISGSGTDGKKYDLYKGKGTDSYRYLFLEDGDDSKETMLDKRFFFKIRTHGYAYGYMWGTAGYPSKKFADMYLCADGLPIDKSPLFEGYGDVASEYKNRDPRMAQTFLQPDEQYRSSENDAIVKTPYNFSERPETQSGYRFHKYITEKRYSAVGLCENDSRLLRYAEVLLNYAEAKYEKNGNITDTDLDLTINSLRDRAGWNVKLTNSFVNSNQLSMLNEIRRERTIELCFEGFRYDDIRRWKTAETELPQALKGVKVTGTEWATKLSQEILNSLKLDENGFIILEKSSNRTFDPAKHYLFSLPLQQLQMNSALRPNNPGWDQFATE